MAKSILEIQNILNNPEHPITKELMNAVINGIAIEKSFQRLTAQLNMAQTREENLGREQKRLKHEYDHKRQEELLFITERQLKQQIENNGISKEELTKEPLAQLIADKAKVLVNLMNVNNKIAQLNTSITKKQAIINGVKANVTQVRAARLNRAIAKAITSNIVIRDRNDNVIDMTNPQNLASLHNVFDKPVDENVVSRLQEYLTVNGEGPASATVRSHAVNFQDTKALFQYLASFIQDEDEMKSKVLLKMSKNLAPLVNFLAADLEQHEERDTELKALDMTMMHTSLCKEDEEALAMQKELKAKYEAQANGINKKIKAYLSQYNAAPAERSTYKSSRS